MRNVKTTLFLGLATTLLTTMSFMAPPRSTGAAANGLGDRTGGPVASSTCSTCHSGGSFGADFNIIIKDGAGAVVTEYIPGSVYTIEYEVTGTSGTGAAFQAVTLNSSNAQAGTFSNLQANTKVTPLNNRSYVEHSSPAALSGGSFKFIADWTAPIVGTGSVNFYGVGLVTNGNGGTSGDQASSAKSVALTEASTVGIEKNTFSELISIFPNPTNNDVALTVNDALENLTVKVFSTAGKLISTNVYSNQNSIALALGDEKGVYFVNVSQDDKEAVYRVIKQ